MSERSYTTERGRGKPTHRRINRHGDTTRQAQPGAALAVLSESEREKRMKKNFLCRLFGKVKVHKYDSKSSEIKLTRWENGKSELKKYKKNHVKLQTVSLKV